MDEYNDYISMLIEKKEKVKTKEYLSWLEKFISQREHNAFNDEDIAYDKDIDVVDKDNCSLISYFFGYIEELAISQSVFYDESKDEVAYFISFNNKMYEIWTIYGQGAVTGVRLVEDASEANDNFVILGRDLTDEEKRERELIEYIVVNKDLTMSEGKIAAQVGHVCGMCAEEQASLRKYKSWKDNYDFKKIILSGHEKKLLELEKEGFFAVRDKGYTELPPNSLTAVSLGIMTRKEAQKYIKRLQLLK